MGDELDEIIYPEIKPLDKGHLKVSENPLHEIYYEEYGNKHGQPVFFLHGGPGSASKSKYARFFNPEKYYVILYHQRGTGESRPFNETKGNTTDELVEDIQKLRKHLNITGKAHIFGGSWGSFLALVYAIKYPELVASITLRGVFLARAKDIYDSYQRDAEKERDDYCGPSNFFPEYWQEFVNAIPENERGEMLNAYYRRINNIDHKYSEDEKNNAIRHWTKWESSLIKLHTFSEEELENDLKDLKKISNNAVLETHYFYNNCFVEDNYIVKNAAKIAHLPIIISQARYDMVTPRNMADALVSAINAERKKLGIEPLELKTPIGGHTIVDIEVARTLVAASDEQLTNTGN